MLSSAELKISNTLKSEPRFQENSTQLIAQMIKYSAAELCEIMKISLPLAKELRTRYVALFDGTAPRIPAVESYNGVVYKHFKDAITSENATYLQQRVRISSLFYGLLRPLDRISPYRMEGFVRLAGTDQRVDRYWRDIQTQILIEDIQAQGGTLLYLASGEERNAFHWSQVKKMVRVIDFTFLQHKGDKLRQVIVYTKMARGEMLRYMMERNIHNPEELKNFHWEGYRYSESNSTPDNWVWVMD